MKKAYNNIKKILKEKKEFEKLKFKDYKKLIKKIDKKIKKKKISFEENEILNKARRIFFVSTSVPSRFSHKQSAFITAIKEGKWVILDGIEMSQIQISEKITTLCDENPEINIFESGEGMHILSKNFNPNYKLFITYNPYNKGSKVLSPILFNKCISFTLTNLDSDKMDVALILNKSMKIHSNKYLWAHIALRLA